MPSSAASAVMPSSLRAKLKVFSPMASSKCLATLYWLITRPTRKPISSRPASLPASTRALIFCRLASVAASSSSRIGEQAVVDLQHAVAAVAAVADLGQRTGAALEVAGRQVVQHQAAGAQVARSELLLDRALARQQPVHRRVQIVLARIGHAEVLGQRRGVPPAGGG